MKSIIDKSKLSLESWCNPQSAKFKLICKIRYDSVQNNRQFGENMMVHPNIADYKVSEMATTIVKLHI